MRKVLWGLAIVTMLSACAGGGGGDSPSSSSGTTRAEGTEAANDESTRSISGASIQVIAHAQFQRFDDYGYDTALNKGLVHKSTMDIRYAEAQLFDSSGTLVQAGTTQNDGTLSSFMMPLTAGTYRLEVHSRGYNNYVRASVLNNPYDKTYYTISQTFTLTGSESGSVAVTLPLASASGTLEGGAFNILNDILLANEYLRAHANGQTSSSASADYCPSSICAGGFTVAPKVQAYWTMGLTPATYYGDSTSPISFFVPTSTGGVYTGLYILGGIEGDVCTDTDHFDNSVIIHEYGHFLEKSFGQSDSPGGSHDGNKVIDPRLAWSEGWADFFQSIVLARPFYRDTQSNSDCGDPHLSFSDFMLNVQTSGQDVPNVAGEGNFREISIARMLRSTVVGSSQGTSYPANSNGVSADFGFAVIWSAFQGMTNSAYHFRNIGYVSSQIYGYLSTLGQNTTSNAWSDDAASPSSTAVLVYEKHRHDLKDYDAALTAQSGASCTGANSTWFPRVIAATEPVGDTYSNGYRSGYLTWSDPMNTNDFYTFYYDGTSNHAVINLDYKANVSGTPYDLDLYLYGEGYVFLDSDSIQKSSEGVYPEGGAASGYTGHESLNLTGLPAGYYLINVKIDYASGDTRKAATKYYLSLGNTGELLCP